MLDAVRNVGINGGTIEIVTDQPITGKETVDATGLVVAPGFIDMHNHNSGVPFGEKLALCDGVTTPLELEAGVSPVTGWYDRLAGKCRSNYGATVGTLPTRERTFNPKYKTVFAGDIVYDLLDAPKQSNSSGKWSTQVPTEEEIGKIRDLLDQGLKEGAIGVGHCAGYMVGGWGPRPDAYMTSAIRGRTAMPVSSTISNPHSGVRHTKGNGRVSKALAVNSVNLCGFIKDASQPR
jgi:hypothetical protein